MKNLEVLTADDAEDMFTLVTAAMSAATPEGFVAYQNFMANVSAFNRPAAKVGKKNINRAALKFAQFAKQMGDDTLLGVLIECICQE